MTPSPTQRLLAIDQAIRLSTEPGEESVLLDPELRQPMPNDSSSSGLGLAALIQRDPEFEAWLSWVCMAAQTHTCGAIEEIAIDRELREAEPEDDALSDDVHASEVSAGNGSLTLTLFMPNGQTLSPVVSGPSQLRFTITAAGNHRLVTTDGTLLWSQCLVDHTLQPPDPGTSPDSPPGDTPNALPGVWRLAAADAETPWIPLQHWELSGWSLSLTLYRVGTGLWLDVAYQKEIDDG